MRVVGDVKCYHCGHVSGQIEGTRTDRLVLHSFIPREGYKGSPPGPGDRIRCERCQGPIFLEDLQPVPVLMELIKQAKTKTPERSSESKAA